MRLDYALFIGARWFFYLAHFGLLNVNATRSVNLIRGNSLERVDWRYHIGSWLPTGKSSNASQIPALRLRRS